MFKKIFEFLFGKKDDAETTEPYPFAESMRELLPSAFSPLIALDLIRRLMDELHLGMTEVEIILLIASEEEPMNLDRIEDQIYHTSVDHIHKLLRNLVKKGHIYRYNNDDDSVIYYLASETEEAIKSFHKE